MTRESDEECLALIASMRARLAFGSDLTKTMAERMLDNLEARIAEADEAPSITCPKCGKTSHSPSDIKARYCGACHLFHDQWVLDECAKESAIRFRDVIREEVERQIEPTRTEIGKAIEDVQQTISDAYRGIAEARRGEMAAFREHVREEVRKEVESCGAAEACRQHVREEVAAEVARQLREAVANEIAAQVLPMAERHAGAPCRSA
jgi:hypothetical protein